MFWFIIIYEANGKDEDVGDVGVGVIVIISRIWNFSTFFIGVILS